MAFTLNEQPRTFTATEIQKLTELEIIRDQIVGLYGQDNRLIYRVSPEQRKQLERWLDRTTKMLDDWRDKWNMNYPL